jgi:hypothetical protein
MDEALKAEVMALIGSSMKPVTDQVGQLAEAVKPVGALVKTVEDLGKNVNVVADTLAKLPPAGASGTKPEEIAKLVGQEVARLQTEKATAEAANTKKAEVQKKVIDTRLKGVPASLIRLPDTDDEKVLTEAADKIRGEIETGFKMKLDDVGGASKEGGETPAAAAEKGAGGGFLKMPGATA